MGPRSDERGNQWNKLMPQIGGRLQWGRVRMNAEMPLLFTSMKIVLATSMGPRSDERGNGNPGR